ncbi:XRE family transcriptional regulator [Streptomyces achromogenes]|uniref:XRE family transcriptional regulator n=1 Tax=Streptomyces achromogenes TaxID=67255 RepID=UPI0004CC852A|nr:XRE family transcriptional regulator [Streptomyces achromogenes]
MPRWKALPDDLDPQIREFTDELRQLVDRSGLGIAALADRTGYGATSWERYLGGRLLAPKGAVIALAEVTGTPPGPLTTLWELAERSWSRAELRDGSTLQALRIAEGESDRKSAGEGVGPSLGKGVGQAAGTGVGQAVGKGVGVSAGQGVGKGLGKGSGKGSGKGGAGSSGPGWVTPAIPAQPSARDAATGVRDGAADGPGNGSGGRTAGGDAGTATRDGSGSGSDAVSGSGSGAAAGGAGAPVKNSWGVAGYRGPSQASARPGARPPGRPNTTAATTPPGFLGGLAGLDATRPLGTPPAGTPSIGTPPAGTPSAGAVPGPARTPKGRPAPGERWSARRQQVVMFFAGLVGVLALIGGVFYVTHRGGDGTAAGSGSPSPSASAPATPPPGVKCAGSACTGKDAEAMGCGGDQVSTAKTATVGTTTLEVRYSKVCGTVWGRITSGAPGDTVRVTAGKERQTGDITAAGDTIGYTPMVAVRNPAQARACATLASGQTGCTE